MDPQSLRKRLGDKQFDVLTPDEYLRKLQLVVNLDAPEVDRRQAKEDLLNAHLRLIAKTVSQVLKFSRANGGFTAGRGGIGIDATSDLFDSMAREVYNGLTREAVKATEGEWQLSTAIVDRVTKRLFDKIKRARADKRTAEFGSVDFLSDHVDAIERLDALEKVLLSESYAMLRSEIEELEGNQKLVFQTMIYGFETGQDLTIADIARALGIPETTARSAYIAARNKLRARFPDMAPEEKKTNSDDQS